MALVPMTRPTNGLGTAGNPINVQLNLFNISLSPSKDFFHYNVEILSSKGTSPPIAMKKRIFKDIHAVYAGPPDGVGPVFDGDKTVYSHKELTPLEGTVSVTSYKLPVEQEEFKYILTEVENLKWRTSDLFHNLFGPQGPTMKNKSEAEKSALINKSRRAMQALNVAIRYPMTTDCPSTSRAFFPEQAPSLDIMNGVILRRGYITHLRAGNTTNFKPPPDNLFLAMDMTCATFLDAPPEGNPANTLADLCCKILNVNPQRLCGLQEEDYRKLHKILRRFKINIKRGESDKGITKSIDHLTLTSSRNEMFETDEGMTSVEAFFLKTWGRRLRYPELPNVVTIGKGKKTVYPMEVCSIRKGQRYILKLSGDQQSAALKFQTVKPAGRFEQIMMARTHVMKSAHEKLLGAYGIKIGQHFVEAQARVLPPPVVEYNSNLRISVSNGQWNIAKPNLQFLTPSPKGLKSWAVVICTSAHLPDPAIMNFLHGLRSKLIQLGLSVADSPPPVIRLTGPGQAAVKDALEKAGKTAWQAFEKTPPQLFLCVTDERSFLYNSIKVEGDNFASRGVTTQCMVLKHVKNPKDQYLSNLALKINLKIGGLNHRLADLESACGGAPTMIVGADLTHNNLALKMKPSIAALVGSLDRTMLKYAPAVGVQPLLEPSDEDGRPRSQEPIQLFRTLLFGLLQKWAKKNPVPKYPRRMIIFRDGVSDGEFSQVLESEFKAAKDAVQKLSGKADECKITFIVCVKNHRLRMSPDSRCQDRSGNAPAGSVLDNRIGDPLLFDFFAQTQAGLQGTSRPTRYVILKDESNSSADQLQAIIQIISSGFQRATRSVGLATPAYYADIVASRAKLWLNVDDDASTVASGSSGRDQTAEERAHDLDVYKQRIESMMSKLESLDQQMWWI
ncbi:hypothetical protein Pst134EA_000288 [Puccinia striiformis f. sp. tritici]|uniref:Piwi domain-containing protein n=1 Tax=Puccinia striiformis f. sp. tritici PST-78 TaxID=1165861 RepID=A0A0L0VRG5_9BASI|nr:hypothetical protein Pst134EA_000288 [Puccinia striiformis f. sp. tritici]KAH9466454.1 hypothetical protein Pst134EB_001508 [Puccinia striiformis f. sp. tritici]KAH9473213.1 hypothetical protein Pst134EA_000288 [Puccinia striiformis f. sp. tritici]KAI9601474.1 hypothetical protein H4Q26_001294 [Puccinia striiformis f. sp. tritici PST-130]KNF01866.1 hypothetical protein PSTG_04985 [Puccinia striiformis f. sp. tritici PST-78]